MADSKPLDLDAGLPRPAVLCTLVRVVGSAPQDVGAKMWVAAEDFTGTLGGGRFEAEVLSHAHEMLVSGRPQAHLKEYVLCKEMGQCCGGRVEVFFDFMPRARTVVLFGAGHVGRAVAQVLSGMPLRVLAVDPRPEWARADAFPADVSVRCAEPVEFARSRRWSEDDAACIFTHSHDLDYLLVEHLLGQSLGYLGLIGSEHKAEVFQARLKSGMDRERAVSVDALWEERVRCPIGAPVRGLSRPETAQEEKDLRADPVASKNPKIIAVSIANELLSAWLGSPART